MIETPKLNAIGWVKITDKDTGEVLLDKKNAVHFGNLASSVAEALASEDRGHVRYMAFGNGGTRISDSGSIIYREPDVSLFRDNSASLYSETFKKELDQNTGNESVPEVSNSNFADIKTTVTLDFVENSLSQDSIDRASSEGDSVFDEMALYTGDPGVIGSLSNASNALLITHIIFHPIQKSANRILIVDYTVRIQLS